MSLQTPVFDAALLAYLRRISEPEPPQLAAIRAEGAAHRLGGMAAAPEQAALLAWLVRLIGARRCLEIGVFTGYSSTAVALALPENGQLTCCDISVTFTDRAHAHWHQAGVADKITLHLQPALITLDELIARGETESYDLAFIDADKPPTPHYYERCLKLVRPGGIIAIDNLLLGGRILNPADEKSPASLPVLQSFNASLPGDPRVEALTLPLGDGLTLLRKRHSATGAA